MSTSDSSLTPTGWQLTSYRADSVSSLSGHSLSPLAHNTVFEALDLPNHRFELHETASFHDASVLERIRSPTFGGGAVTMPHKVEALPYMDSLGDEVNEIGSMNTIVVTGHVEENGVRRPRLEGRNTDTEGIRRALLSTLAEEMRNRAQPFGEGKSAFISAALSSFFPAHGRAHMDGALTFRIAAQSEAAEQREPRSMRFRRWACRQSGSLIATRPKPRASSLPLHSPNTT